MVFIHNSSFQLDVNIQTTKPSFLNTLFNKHLDIWRWHKSVCLLENSIKWKWEKIWQNVDFDDVWLLELPTKFRESFSQIYRDKTTNEKRSQNFVHISTTALQPGSVMFLKLIWSLLILETLVYLESPGHEPEQLQVSELPQGGGRVWGRVKISSAQLC